MEKNINYLARKHSSNPYDFWDTPLPILFNQIDDSIQYDKDVKKAHDEEVAKSKKGQQPSRRRS